MIADSLNHKQISSENENLKDQESEKSHHRRIMVINVDSLSLHPRYYSFENNFIYFNIFILQIRPMTLSDSISLLQSMKFLKILKM